MLIGQTLVVLALVCGGILLLRGIPFRFANLSQPCDISDPTACVQIQATSEGVQVLADWGIPVEVYALFNVFAEGYIVLAFLLSAVILFWRRSDEPIALVTALALSIFPLAAFSIVVDTQRMGGLFATLIGMAQTIGPSLLYTIIFIFPDGRFIPRWTLWASIAWLALLLGFPRLGIAALTPIFFVFAAVWLALGVYSQIFRFRHVSSSLQRQQTKWVVLGFGGFLAGTLLLLGPSLALPAIFTPYFLPASTGSDLIYRSIYYLILVVVPISMMPISFALSILRLRLWNVDPIINRTLVYGALTLFLGLVFALGFAGMRAALEEIFGSEQVALAAAASAGIIVALFNPARRALRRFVDKQFYGIKIEYSPSARPIAGHVGKPVTSLGVYTDLTFLGAGGMGEVYRAVDGTTGNPVAIKVLPVGTAMDTEAKRRFEREAQVVTNLEHPNIVKLLGFGKEDERAYMVMEYISGGTLSDILKSKGRLARAEALAILEKMAEALDHAHSRGIVHRDIKPGNVMVDEKGRPVLMDFGIARMAAMTQLTATGGMMGTLDYIAPEQIQGATNVSGQADIYALGVMTYQMLTGELPFRKNNAGALVLAHLMEPPPDACERVRGLGETVCAAIQQAMAKKPEDRYESVGAFVAALAGG